MSLSLFLQIYLGIRRIVRQRDSTTSVICSISAFQRMIISKQNVVCLQTKQYLLIARVRFMFTLKNEENPSCVIILHHDVFKIIASGDRLAMISKPQTSVVFNFYNRFLLSYTRYYTNACINHFQESIKTSAILIGVDMFAYQPVLILSPFFEQE